MFNMLNIRIREGKKSPMVCKFLDSVSGFRHDPHLLLQRPCYLPDRMGLRHLVFLPVGLRIAFSIFRPAYNRSRSGKD